MANNLPVVITAFSLALIFEGVGIASLIIFLNSDKDIASCAQIKQLFLLVYGHISVIWGCIWLAFSVLLKKVSIGEITENIYATAITLLFCFFTVIYLVSGLSLSAIEAFSVCQTPYPIAVLIMTIFILYVLITGVFLLGFIYKTCVRCIDEN